MLDIVAASAAELTAYLRERSILADGTVTGMASAGAGNMNRTLRIEHDQGSLILKQSVPFVAKYPDIPAPVERINAEAAFYRVTCEKTAIARYMPAVLDFDPGNHILVLEDLGIGADFTDAYPSGKGDCGNSDVLARHLPALFNWLSALHAIRDLPADELLLFDNRDMRRLNHAHIFEIPFQADNGIDLDAITPGLAASAAACAIDDALIAKAQALGEMYLGRYDSAAGRSLLHGDFYPGSWLREPATGVRVIDPEFTFLGPPEFDVGVLIAHLALSGWDNSRIEVSLEDYAQPAGFSASSAKAFAGVEIIRRLLGVAQLPLVADLTTKRSWLDQAHQWVMDA